MLRRQPALGTALASALLVAAVQPARAQFNPEGRPAPQRSATSRVAGPIRPEAARASSLRHALRHPEDLVALERTIELHRAIAGGLTALRTSLEEAIERPESARAGHLHLAWLLRSSGLREEAQKVLEVRLRAAPRDALALERLAHLLAERQLPEEAYRHLARAAKYARRSRRSELLAELVQWAIQRGHRQEAREHHQAWVRSVGAGPAGALELPRQLRAGGHLRWAAEEYQTVAQDSTLPSGERPTLWSEWGTTLVELGRFERAIEILAKASRAGKGQPGLRAEVFEQQVRAYRGLGRLGELADRMAESPRRGVAQALAMGRLCEQLGRLDCAEAALRRALRQRPASREARLQLLYVLQQQGKLREALAQRERLAKEDPADVNTGLALARERLQRGQRRAALSALGRLERNTRKRGEAQAQLADFYESMGEPKRAQALLERHARTRNRGALLALGERHFVRGEDAAAARTWQRWVAKRSEEPEAWLELGQIFLDHDLLPRGLQAIERAHRLSGGGARERRALALALERVGAAATAEEQRAARYRQAQSLWRVLASEAESRSNPPAAEEARNHLVTLWALSETLAEQAQRLSTKLEAMPQDRTTQRLLAKAYARLGRPEEAEALLLALLEHSPRDSILEDQLEQAWAAQGKTEAVLERLEQRAQREPERALEYWQRMARYAAQGHDDALALQLSQQAATRAPLSGSTVGSQVQALADLAERHLAVGQLEEAGHAYEAVLRREPGRHDLRLLAARVLLWRGHPTEALEQLLAVSESSRQETLVRSAGELALGVASQERSLQTVARRWLRSYVRHSTRATLRDLLLEAYERQLPQQPAAVRGEGGQTRATKLLVDTLQSRELATRLRAIRLLQHLPSAEANPALLHLAKTAPTATERTNAILAATLRPDPASFDSLASLVGTGMQATVDPVARQATWALARANHPRARALLAPLQRHPSPELRTLAVLSTLEGPAPAPNRDSVGQPGYELTWAAALWAQAKRGAAQRDGESLLLHSGDALLRGTALLSLTLRAPEQALQPIAAALLHADATLRQAALGAACLLVSPPEPRRLHPVTRGARELPRPPTARDALRAQWPRSCPLEQRLTALERLVPALEGSVRTLPGDAETVQTLAALLTRPNGKPQLEALFPLEGARQRRTEPREPGSDPPSPPPPPKSRRQAALVERVQRAALPAFLRAAAAPDARTRQAALRWLAGRPEDDALAALLLALRDPEPALRQQVLRALEGESRSEAAAALLDIAQGPAPWSERHAALAAMAKLAPQAAAGVPRQRLARLAERDRYAAVRKEATDALGRLYGSAALPVLQRVRSQDAEPLVRRTAAAWLKELP